ncbi:MAG: DUF4304 domain-containing protein [Rhizobium sp.]|nr:DUF4304 domain-containing protein [Rhizobium sp.]
MSLTTTAIRSISSGPVGDLLKPFGFKRLAPHYWRDSDGLFHVVNFQASQWGTRDEGRFTINLAVSQPDLYYAFTGKAFPSNPASALWPINVRIGHLVPDQRDLWWKVSASSDLRSIGAEVAVVLREYGLPFFQQYASAASLSAALLGTEPISSVYPAQRPLIAAALCARLNRPDDASKLLNAALQSHAGKPFEQTIRALANRLGISLRGA